MEKEIKNNPPLLKIITIEGEKDNPDSALIKKA